LIINLKILRKIFSMNRKDTKLLVESWRRLLENVEENVYVYMCSDPNWMGANFKDNFDNEAIKENNPYGLVEQLVNVDALYGFESELKLSNPASRKKVDQIKELIEKGEDEVLPAILVRHKMEEGKELQVIDGHHRYWAYKELSKENNAKKAVKVRVVPERMIEEVMFKEDLPESLYREQ
jgi:hypothetical protein